MGLTIAVSDGNRGADLGKAKAKMSFYVGGDDDDDVIVVVVEEEELTFSWLWWRDVNHCRCWALAGGAGDDQGLMG